MSRVPQWDADCAVIGGGPGGLVAALYLRRFRRATILFSEGVPRVAWGTRVHNLIGYDRGISGKSLLRHLEAQLAAVGGLRRVADRVTVRRLRGRGAGFEVLGRRGRRWRVRKVILATGIRDRHPQIQNLVPLRRLGLLKYCSICDGYEMRGQPVAVLANDDAGLQKAIFLGGWTRRIRVLVPLGFKPAPVRVPELRAVGARLVPCEGFRLEAAAAGKSLWVHAAGHRRFRCRVAYVELGCDVNDDAYAGMRGLNRTREGYLVVTSEQRTSVGGLFAVGDCVNLLGQIGVAAGQAAVAATAAHNELL